MSYNLANSDVGFSNLKNYDINLASGVTTFTLSFANLTSGIYQVVISNFSTAECWIGYVNWYNSTNPLSILATPVNAGITVAASSPNLNLSALNAGYHYYVSISYIGKTL